MLTDGIHHVAILTNDTDRFTAFYRDVFDATINAADSDGPVRLTFVTIGAHTELNVFEIDNNHQADHQTPCSAGAASTTSGCGRRPSTLSTRSAIGS